MTNKKDNSKKKVEPSNYFLTVRVDKEYKKRFDSKAEKEKIKPPDVIKYLADGWLNGNIAIEIHVDIKQKK